MLCLWHALRNFRKTMFGESAVHNKHKVTAPDGGDDVKIRQDTMDLVVQMSRTDNKAEYMIAEQDLRRLLGDCSTNFLKYLDENYLNRREQWCRAWRVLPKGKYLAMPTSMHIEASYRVLKHKYLRGIANRRLDILVLHLLQLSIIRAMLTHSKSKVRLGPGRTTDAFPTTSRVVQGDAMSPTLFIALLDLVLASIDQDLGVHIGDGHDAGGRLATDAYADDIAVIAETETNAQLIVAQVEKLARPLGLELNAAKCEAMHFGEKTKPPTITLGEEVIEVVDSFIYLGSKISARPAADDEVKRRRAVAHGQMLKLT